MGAWGGGEVWRERVARETASDKLKVGKTGNSCLSGSATATSSHKSPLSLPQILVVHSSTYHRVPKKTMGIDNSSSESENHKMALSCRYGFI